MNKRGAILLGAIALVLIEPYLYNIYLYAPWHSGLMAESSIFSLDRGRFFSDFLANRSEFMAGTYSVFPLNYFIWYALWSGVSALLPDITSYFVLIIAFSLLSFYCFVKLLLTVGGDDPDETDFHKLAVVGLLGLLYLTSLSNFNYVKSNILFLLPYLVLPPLLYFSLRFIRTNEKRYLIPYLLISLVLSDFNLAHTLILAGFLNVFLVLQWRSAGVSFGAFLARLAIVNALLVPAFCFLLIVVADNILYSADLSTFAVIAAENMYSNNARYLNIFSQLTDWGLFGAWNGESYYAFGTFYEYGPVMLFGLLPYVLLGYGALVAKKASAQRGLTVSLLVLLLVIFQIMLGNNNPVYKFLYDHVIFFQVFRNITKLAPLLYLVLVIAIYVLLRERLAEKRHLWITIALIAGALLYNLPFWSYQGYFFRDRAVKEIPSYWREAATYVDDTASPYSRILALPAIYVNDIYMWDEKKTWVQGNLLDVLVRNRSYRLSECCIGPPQFAFDARHTFVPSDRSIRKLDVDYDRLSLLVRKYRLDYVIVTSDLVSEYQDPGDIVRWLAKDGYTKVRAFGPVAIYRNPRNFSLPFEGPTLSFQRVNNLRYRLHIRELRGTQRLEFYQPFQSAWELYLDPSPDDSWCRPTSAVGRITVCAAPAENSPLSERRALFGTNHLAAPHLPSTERWNTWMLDAGKLRRTVAPSYYTTNPDGSIDLSLDLYFKPQAIFYGVLLLGVLCLIAALTYLVAGVWLQPGRRSIPRAALAVAGCLFAVLVSAAAVDRVGRLPRPSPSGVSEMTVDFRDPRDVAQVVTLYPHTPGAPSHLVFVANSCARIAGLYPRMAGNAMQMLVVPTSPGTCTVSLADRKRPAAGVVSIRIHVGERGSLSLAPSSEVPAKTLLFRGPQAPTQSVNVYYHGSGGLSALTFGENTCAAIAGLYPQKAGTAIRALVVPVGPGSCSVSLLDPQHPNDGSVSIRIHVGTSMPIRAGERGALSLAPSLEVPAKTLWFGGPQAPTQSVNVYYRGSGGLSGLTFGENTCAAIAGLYPQRAGTAVQALVIPIGTGSCSVSLLDPQHPDDGSVSIRIHVGERHYLSLAQSIEVPAKALRIVSQKTVDFRDPQDVAQVVTLYPHTPGVPSSLAFVANGCARVAGLYPRMAGNAMQTLVVPTGPGICSASLADPKRPAAGIVSIRIHVGEYGYLSLAPAIEVPEKTLRFRDPQAPIQSVTVYYHGSGGLSGLTFGENTCAAIAGLYPQMAGTAIHALVVPIGPGSCSVNLLDPHHPEDGRVSIRIRVGERGYLSLAPSIKLPSETLRFRDPLAPTQSVNVYYHGSGGLSGLTFGENTCVAIAGLYPERAGTAIRTVVVPVGPGSCSVSLFDPQHPEDGSVSIRIQVGERGYLSLAPSIHVPVKTLRFEEPQAPTQSVNVYYHGSGELSGLTFGENTCAAIAGLYPQKAGAAIHAAVVPIGPGSCSINLFDPQHPEDGSVLIRVQVGEPGYLSLSPSSKVTTSTFALTSPNGAPRVFTVYYHGSQKPSGLVFGTDTCAGIVNFYPRVLGRTVEVRAVPLRLGTCFANLWDPHHQADGTVSFNVSVKPAR